MRRNYIGLSKIDATDPLAQLFNAYFHELHTLALTCEPEYVTMREVRQGFYEGKKKKRSITDDAVRHYSLCVLFGSLEAIHGHVVGAIDVLEKFFAEHNGNLAAFAIANRLRLIDEYSSDDETDWREDGLDEQGAQKWAVVYKDDPESLQHYTLYSELERFFGDGGTRGEYLGLSDYTDFYPYTAAVEQASEFSLRKAFAGAFGKEVTFTNLQPDGSAVPMTLADHIEDEMNEDIRNGGTVLRFNTVLHNLMELGQIFRRPTMKATDDQHLYQCALNLLVAIRDQTLRFEAEQPNEQ